jgi:hypothetical protein
MNSLANYWINPRQTGGQMCTRSERRIEMEPIKQISRAVLLVASNELTPARQTTSLVDKELDHFQNLCRQMLAYYPSQEFAPETIDGYFLELERLAVKHGLSRLERAFVELRGKPGQRFFPHPTEVAEAIELQIKTERDARESTAQTKREARERAERIEFFWTKFVPDRMVIGPGISEPA